jgi:iron complex transport system ATP-binding protein
MGVAVVMVISASGVSFSYGDRPVLTEAGLTARAGEVVGVIGPNGSGKSTFLRTLYGALRPRAGLICVDDTLVASLAPAAVARRIGVVAQEPPSGIPLTVADMVLLGRSPHRAAFERYTASDRDLAVQALREAGVEHLARRNYEQLSGGEKQRVLIARALAQDTDHLLLDEPTSHLDIHHQHTVLRCVRSLGVTTVVVLHDLNLAARYCDRIVLLHDGDVVAVGDPDTVLTPEVLGPVYQVRVRRIEEPDCVQMIFSLDEPPADASNPRPSRNASADPAVPIDPDRATAPNPKE